MNEAKRSESLLTELLSGNGENEFCIVAKCPHTVYSEELAELLFGINWYLTHHKDGKFANVGAFLEEAR